MNWIELYLTTTPTVSVFNCNSIPELFWKNSKFCCLLTLEERKESCIPGVSWCVNSVHCTGRRTCQRSLTCVYTKFVIVSPIYCSAYFVYTIIRRFIYLHIPWEYHLTLDPVGKHLKRDPKKAVVAGGIGSQ